FEAELGPFPNAAAKVRAIPGGRLLLKRPPLKHARYLQAAPGRKPSDQATLLGHGTADRLAVHANGVGEPPNRADFGDQGGRGGKSVGGKVRRRARFGL